MRNRATSLLAVSLAAITVASAQVEHHRVSRDAFLREQYVTKDAFIEGLRSHPRALRAMAECVDTNSDSLIKYIDEHVVLGRLAHSGKYLVWGMNRAHHIYKSWHYFRAGMKVWETSDGIPVFRWVCGNPMVTSLPVYESKAVEQQHEQPAAPPPAEPPAQTPPPPAPTPAPPQEQPMTEPAPTPAPAPEPAPTPAPAPQAAPTPPLAVARTYTRPFRFQVGGIIWTNRDTEGQGIFTFGGTYDLWESQWGSSVGIYFDTAGLVQNHPTYRFYGGGVEFRQMLDPNKADEIRPYIGIGAGGYRIDIRDELNQGTTRFGGKAFFGLESRCGFFLEAQYNYFGSRLRMTQNVHTGARDLGTFGVSIGYRF